ncbi:MAG: leucyl aminopeptidase family protein, partial [Gammaproteobacteria bacterium]|nr:leucyl aminopeptidase family protein [Gammaproteobacteria bacterium]
MSAANTVRLPTQPELRVLKPSRTPVSKLLGKTEHLLIVVPEKPPVSIWRQLPDGTKLRKIAGKSLAANTLIRSRLANAAGTGITLGKLPGTGSGKKAVSAFERLSFSGRLAADVCGDNPASVAVLVAGFDAVTEAAILESLLLALAAHRFNMPVYKSEPTSRKRLNSVRILKDETGIDVPRILAEANATNLVRWLTSQPPNFLDAKMYLALLRSLAKDKGWKLSFLSEAKLKKAGAGAFLAVSQGNAMRDAGIVHIRYRPKKSAVRPKIALVGKGIIFDTGGNNLKPFKGMLDMHQDMAGSAVAVATLAALTDLEAPFAVDCWLAITENRVSANAYKPRDIVTASNGVSIEVIHTDAEGRMALADTLALAAREQPTAIVDFATLTGSCIAALTERYSGALTNRPTLNELLIDTGRRCGERIWPFPMDHDFDEELRSEVADVMQCAPAGGGDHIQAARFLNRFIPDHTAWVHIDLSSASRKGGLAQVPGEVTGFGARYAINLVLDSHEQLAA